MNIIYKNNIVTLYETLLKLSMPIVKLTKIDDSSHKDNVVIILTCIFLSMNEWNSVIYDEKENKIRFL